MLYLPCFWSNYWKRTTLIIGFLLIAAGGDATNGLDVTILQLELNHHSGVYILSQNFIIAPKRDKRMLNIFIIAPNLHFACNGISVNLPILCPRLDQFERIGQILI